MKTTWRKCLESAAETNGEKFEDLIITIDDGELDREFDDGYGREEGAPFTAWSERLVYFPICYDGSEWIGCAPRNPCDIKLRHQGGG